MLSKSTLLRHFQCPLSLYMHKKRPYLRDKIPPERLAMFRQGTQIGKIARDYFPGGLLIPTSPSAYKKAAEVTKAAIEAGETTIYEAAFMHNDVLVLLDILVKIDDDWYAYEVKSSWAVSKTNQYDATIQYETITASGLPLKDFFIMHLKPGVEKTTAPEKLLAEGFTFRSVLHEISTHRALMIDNMIRANETLLRTSSPIIEMGEQCRKPYDCDFIGFCTKRAAQ